MAIDALKGSSRDFPKPDGDEDTVNEASEEAIERYVSVVAKMVEKKVVELEGPTFLEKVPPQDIIDAAKEIPMLPANDRMKDEDIEDLMGRGTDIERAASNVIVRHKQLPE